MSGVLRPSQSPIETPREQWYERVLGQRWVLRLVIPGLVALSGVAVLLVGDSHLRHGMDRLAQARFTDQSAVVAQHLNLSLQRAQTRLDALYALYADTGEPSREQFATFVRLSMENNPLFAGLGCATPDGRFRCVRRDANGLLYRESSAAGGSTDWRLGPNGAGTPQPTLPGEGARPWAFWQEVTVRGQRAWSQPYLASGHGSAVACVVPVAGRDGPPRALLVLEIDSDSLAAALRQLPVIPGSQLAVFTTNGTLLGASGGPLPSRSGRPVVGLFDLGDPELEVAVAATLSGRPEGSLDAATGLRIAARPVSPGPGVIWQVLSYAPESEVAAAVGNLRAVALAVDLLVLVAACSVGWLVSEQLARVRAQREAARWAAQQAKAEASDLGAYRLVRLLGSGGMGEVWLGAHRQLARRAAIKLIRVKPGADVALLRERFVREAQVIARLRCRSTIDLYDYGVADDGTLYYVMELLEGWDLDELVRRHGAQTPARVIHLLIQICRSLAEAHDLGLVHRDIKPANIYLCRMADEVDLVKVLDFGLVRGAVQGPGPVLMGDGVETEAGMVFGTPACMAPEQAQDLALDNRTDLYAVGCVAWWLLTGQTVYPAIEHLAQMRAHVNDPIPDLAALRPSTPPGLVTLIRELLAKAPEDRPRDARTVLQRLERLLPDCHPPWDEPEAAAWWQANGPTPQELPPSGV